MTNCNGNYNKQNKENVFRLPTEKEDNNRWINAIPRDNIHDSADTVVCERHFPSGYPTVTKFGHKKPRDPPSVFKCVKPSLIPTSPPPLRTTFKASSPVRNIMADELEMFLAADKIACFRSLYQKLQIKEIDFGVVDVTWNFAGEHLLIIESTDFEENSSIVRFILKVKNDLTFEGYFCEVKHKITSSI